jgi:hypothetical protein
MYSAKEERRNAMHFFSPGINDKALELPPIEIESEMRIALDRNQFYPGLSAPDRHPQQQDCGIGSSPALTSPRPPPRLGQATTEAANSQLRNG